MFEKLKYFCETAAQGECEERVHILLAEQWNRKALDGNDFWVNVYMSSRTEVEAAGERVGDRIVWNPTTRQHDRLPTDKVL